MVQADGIMSAFLFVGDVSGTGGPTLDTTIQESDDGTTWTPCVGGTFAQKTTQNTIEGLQIQRQKRYLRAVNVVGGTTSPLFNTSCIVFELWKTLPQS